jgi:hypothetical protein
MSGFLTGRTSLTTVQTGNIAADAVTAAKLPDDVIDSEHYAAGSIDSAHLADDAVTLAKMAAGTDGVIITYDASGNPAHVGPGSDGEVLTSTGAGSPPAFEAAGGGVGFTSSDQTVTADTLLDVSHSLGAIPTRWSVRLKCNSAESGYVANDELDVGGVINDVPDSGVTYQADATNITIVTGQYIYVTVQSTGNHSNITVGKWRWVVRASL